MVKYRYTLNKYLFLIVLRKHLYDFKKMINPKKLNFLSFTFCIDII